MSEKQVVKWHHLGNGVKVGKWCGHRDVRGFRCPEGFEARAFTPDTHPITDNDIGYEWWIEVRPETEDCHV